MRKDIHYYGLDILRLAAAALVLADHFGLYGWASPTAYARGADLAFPALHGMSDIGSIGVEIFFLISGFVIAASAKGVSATQFALNRAIRVFPALWICGLVALAARWSAGEPLGVLIPAFVRSAVLSPSGEHIDGVVWTLIVEAVFYILVFLVLLTGRFDRIEVIAKWLGVVSAIFVTIMAAVVVAAAFDPRLVKLAALLDRFPTKVFLLRHGMFFALGILVWSGFETSFSRAKIAWMGALALFCTIEIAIDRPGVVTIVSAIALWWAGFATILVSVAKSATIQTHLRRWSGVLKDMGRLSYPLYLNHYILAMVLVPTLFAHGLTRVPAFVVALGLVVATSYLIMRYPERIAQRYLRMRLSPRTRAPGVVPSFPAAASPSVE